MTEIHHTLQDPLAPPWLMYPHIFRGSIGWRMGYGETYSMQFGNWLRALSAEDRQAYEAMFPAPHTWYGFYAAKFDREEYSRRFRHGVPLWHPDGAPRYTREKLAAARTQLKGEDCVFFWNPGDGPQDCLSQWQPTPFKYGHVSYSCAEQYMMVGKAGLFKDDEVQKQILTSDSPGEMKRLGRKVRGFDGAVWDEVKYTIVLNGNYAKFSQDENLRAYLLATGELLLAEASPADCIWGIGLEKDKPDALRPGAWRGQNLLGFALMEVRDELRRVYQNYDRVDWERLRKETKSW